LYAYQGGLEVESRADQYRRLAAECLALSHLGFSMRGRLNLLEMARLWNRLADKHYLAKPVVQQQVQPKKKEG